MKKVRNRFFVEKFGAPNISRAMEFVHFRYMVVTVLSLVN